MTINQKLQAVRFALQIFDFVLQSFFLIDKRLNLIEHFIDEFLSHFISLRLDVPNSLSSLRVMNFDSVICTNMIQQLPAIRLPFCDGKLFSVFHEPHLLQSFYKAILLCQTSLIASCHWNIVNMHVWFTLFIGMIVSAYNLKLRIPFRPGFIHLSQNFPLGFFAGVTLIHADDGFIHQIPLAVSLTNLFIVRANLSIRSFLFRIVVGHRLTENPVIGIG